MKLTTIFLRIVYPGVLSTLLLEQGFEAAKDYCWKIGYNASKYIFKWFKPKSNKFEGIADELGPKLWGTKFLMKYNKKTQTYRVKPKSCPLCEDMPPLEMPDLHYCFPLEGFFHGYFELLREHGLFDYKELNTKVIQSKGSGADYCLYEVQVIK